MAEIRDLPRLISETLALDPVISRHAKMLAKRDGSLFLGRGVCYPIALEGALKLKEISYTKAEGYAAGELKHGLISLVEDGYPVIELAPDGPLLDKTLSIGAEVEAHGGNIITNTNTVSLSLGSALTLPASMEFLFPFTSASALQLLAYHAVCMRGCEVDKPRNLAKSVTVE